MNRKEKAVDLHKNNNFNCAQATACVFCEELGFDAKEVFKLAEAFGYGMGGSDLPTNKREAFGGATAGGVTIQPIAFLIVKDGNVQLVQLAGENNTAERAMNMVPDVVDKISGIIADRQGKKPAKAPEHPEG